MGRRKAETPRGQIRSVLRQLWLRSRERSAALKRDNYTCQECHKKQSKAKGKEFKVEVHHKKGVANWDWLIDQIYHELLCHPNFLETLCPDCHKQIENNKKKDIDIPF